MKIDNSVSLTKNRSAMVIGIHRIRVVLFLFTCVACCSFAQDPWELLYTSHNLTNHEVSVECNPAYPAGYVECYTSDVKLVSHEDYGEVIANVEERYMYVNAIGYKRFDIFPDGSPINLDVFKYKADVRLPVIPIAYTGQVENAGAAHMMVQLWDGSNQLWQSSKVALEATAMWCLDPWNTNYLGKILVYTVTTGALELVDTGLTLPLDTNWHSIEFAVDFAHSRFVYIRADSAYSDISTVAVARVHRPLWGNELVYQITQESMHTFPGLTYPYIFRWNMEYRNVEFSRLAQTVSCSIRNDSMALQWDSVPYMNYQVYTSGNVESWGFLSEDITGDGATITYTNIIDAAASRFYHLQVAP